MVVGIAVVAVVARVIANVVIPTVIVAAVELFASVASGFVLVMIRARCTGRCGGLLKFAQ